MLKLLLLGLLWSKKMIDDQGNYFLLQLLSFYYAHSRSQCNPERKRFHISHLSRWVTRNRKVDFWLRQELKNCKCMFVQWQLVYITFEINPFFCWSSFSPIVKTKSKRFIWFHRLNHHLHLSLLKLSLSSHSWLRWTDGAWNTSSC